MSRFEINNINLITTSNFVLDKNTDCTICRQSLNTFSIYAKEKNITEIVHLSGTCGHTFHEECLLPWLKSQNKCPICSNKMTIICKNKI